MITAFLTLYATSQVFLGYARKFVANGADFLTIQANDGWLGKSKAGLFNILPKQS